MHSQKTQSGTGQGVAAACTARASRGARQRWQARRASRPGPPPVPLGRDIRDSYAPAQQRGESRFPQFSQRRSQQPPNSPPSSTSNVGSREERARGVAAGRAVSTVFHTGARLAQLHDALHRRAEGREELVQDDAHGVEVRGAVHLTLSRATRAQRAR